MKGMDIQLKRFFDYPCGIRYMFDSLKTSSSVTMRFIADSVMMRDRKSIEDHYAALSDYIGAFGTAGQDLDLVRMKLCGIRDIRNSISRLGAGTVLDDIELFEIKSLALNAGDIAEICGKSFPFIEIGQCGEVLAVLDPEGNRIPSFYIYDCYSSELKAVRTRFAKAPEEEKDGLYREILVLEDGIRKNLCRSLQPYADRLSESLASLINADRMIATAELFIGAGLCIPSVSEEETSYRGMFHPQIADTLKDGGKEFQPVDISAGKGITTIIGANMGGKTVVLKMLALNQLLFQFGFGAAAAQAAIALKEDVMVSIGDDQNELKGISSFAAEMKNIDAMIKASDRGVNMLALVDEPARTTNPIEGAALVGGLIRRLENSGISMVLTTHYNTGHAACRRYRVRGFENGRMDYRLVETATGEVPHEALNIAASLGIDSRWIGYAGELL